jgi:isoquinoline 1-oxidoreductase subunit alpha
VVTDATRQCFECHQPKKSQDESAGVRLSAKRPEQIEWEASAGGDRPRTPPIAVASEGDDTMAFTIRVNGDAHSVDVDGDTPLLWVLRDVLGMTGTKFGCGMALCGACTVHLDGVATRSCITPIESIGTSAITTIEAIGATPAGAGIQKAWLDLEVVQCGYCQSGQIMSASALLASTPHPTDSDIDGAMSGNICRCGTYVRIRAAIKQAAQSNAQGG